MKLRDVLLTRLQSIQIKGAIAARYTNKGKTHHMHLPKHPYISGCKQLKQLFCTVLEFTSISYNYHALMWDAKPWEDA